MASRLIVELNSGKYGNPLKPFHRAAMLDLVLAWGSLDGALTILISELKGEELHVTAKRLIKTNGTTKILEIISFLKESKKTSEFVKTFKKLKKRYEKYSKPRNRIAHAHCAGYLLGHEQYIVFAVAEPEEMGRMVVEAIPVEEMIVATEYAKTVTEFALKTADRISDAREG